MVTFLVHLGDNKSLNYTADWTTAREKPKAEQLQNWVFYLSMQMFLRIASSIIAVPVSPLTYKLLVCDFASCLCPLLHIGQLQVSIFQWWAKALVWVAQIFHQINFLEHSQMLIAAEYFCQLGGFENMAFKVIYSYPIWKSSFALPVAEWSKMNVNSQVLDSLNIFHYKFRRLWFLLNSKHLCCTA